jgi:hypothetical protein
VNLTNDIRLKFVSAFFAGSIFGAGLALLTLGMYYIGFGTIILGILIAAYNWATIQKTVDRVNQTLEHS